MGGMMSGGAGMGAWMFLWIILGLAVVAAVGVVTARVLTGGHQPEPPKVPPPMSSAMPRERPTIPNLAAM